MGAGRSKRHRKKRISKHVIDSQKRKKQEDAEKKLMAAAEGVGEASTSADEVSAVNDSDSKKSPLKTKDPEEAASYLSLWKFDRNSTSTTKTWKFNKNTQSWLLRHMYDFDKVSKSTFATLVDYICQGGDGTRLRVEEEAKRRARRYKDWEKRQQEQNKVDAEQEENVPEETKDTKSLPDDDERWNKLDDHDKRKEYKRTRKLLDALRDAFKQ